MIDLQGDHWTCPMNGTGEVCEIWECYCTDSTIPQGTKSDTNETESAIEKSK